MIFVMTLAEFRTACLQGGFEDKDGDGYLGIKVEFNKDNTILPSDFKDPTLEINAEFTHVLWINK